MADFDLSRLDLSKFDLSYLHRTERNRSESRQFNTHELSALLSWRNPWTKSGKPGPLPADAFGIPEPRLTGPKPFNGVFHNIDPSQTSSDASPPGEFESFRTENSAHDTHRSDPSGEIPASSEVRPASFWRKPLGRSNIETYFIFIWGIFLVVLPMNATTRSLLLLPVLGLLIDIMWRSPWTIKWQDVNKALTAMLLLSAYLVVVVLLFVSESNKSNPDQPAIPAVSTPLQSLAPSTPPIVSPSIAASPSPRSSPTPQVVRVNPSASPINVPSGFTPAPVTAQLEVSGARGQNVLEMLRKQADYKGPETVLQFEVRGLSQAG